MNTTNKNIIFHLEKDESFLAELSQMVAKELSKEKTFTLWLKGEMGTGKTTLTRYLLRYFGLPSTIPVTSPTFSYINEYLIGDDLFIHMDLFRATEGDFDIEDLGITHDRAYKGFILEWPSVAKGVQMTLPATHILEISYCNNLQVREYQFYKV
jgi:tRNA threonylcarbamoyl adenosine modification protein YjeE